MLVYKLQIWLLDEEEGDEGTWRDFYFDVHKINGWFIPDKNANNDDKAINILFEGDTVTIKQEPHILDWLAKNFGKNAVSK